jgi:outer membrane protein insertion porin family
MTFRLLRTLSIVVAATTFAGVAGAQDAARVAVLPVVIHSIEESAYLRAGISEMLTSRLSQQAGVGAVRVDDAGAATADADAARAAGRAAGASWVVYGSFTRFGEGASLDLRCIPVDSEGSAGPRSVFVHAGALSELIPRLDGVVARMGTHIRGGAAAASAPLAVAPSVDVQAELAALKARIEALEARGAQAAQLSAAAGTSSN